MSILNFNYGNRTLRAIPIADKFWFLLEDVSAMAGVVYRGRDLVQSGLRPGIDFIRVNVTALPDDVGNTHIMRGQRVLVSDGGFFELVFRGRSEYSVNFRNWVKDELWHALVHDGYYVAEEGSLVKELLDKVVVLEAEVEVMRAMRRFGPDAPLSDMVGWND